MREATPYVKKGSPVSEIGWETPPPESPRPGTSPSFSTPTAPPGPAPTPPRSLPLQGDRRCIPLKMCYVTRSLTEVDPDKRWGEAHTHWHTAPPQSQYLYYCHDPFSRGTSAWHKFDFFFWSNAFCCSAFCYFSYPILAPSPSLVCLCFPLTARLILEVFVFHH